MPQKIDSGDRFAVINRLIDQMTMEHGCEWFDPIRSDPRFCRQLELLKAKKTELEEYFADHSSNEE